MTRGDSEPSGQSNPEPTLWNAVPCFPGANRPAVDAESAHELPLGDAQFVAPLSKESRPGGQPVVCGVLCRDTLSEEPVETDAEALVGPRCVAFPVPHRPHVDGKQRGKGVLGESKPQPAITDSVT